MPHKISWDRRFLRQFGLVRRQPVWYTPAVYLLLSTFYQPLFCLSFVLWRYGFSRTFGSIALTGSVARALRDGR